MDNHEKTKRNKTLTIYDGVYCVWFDMLLLWAFQQEQYRVLGTQIQPPNGWSCIPHMDSIGTHPIWTISQMGPLFQIGVYLQSAVLLSGFQSSPGALKSIE